MRTEILRRSVVLAGGALLLAGCSASPEPQAEPPAAPSASSPAFRFTVPAEIDGLPQTTTAKWTKVAQSATRSLKRNILRPLDTLTAVYVDTSDPAEGVELSAVAGEVADPASQLRLITGNLTGEWQDAEIEGGVGTCSVNREERPLIRTDCYWAEPGSVGRVSLWGLKDRRKDFPAIQRQFNRGTVSD
ncbi:hypothetical protein Asp14428_36580 [Actinoplanes sp. NBRC 14428]|uniref:Lipoprotein n=1 Tax=Pseudosporangium ferrugineum TaxID=439699 RepID=A0A2T0S3S4_9ACTN|nr:hypothetical protein [Pseudosporangium ferrugineum]PRY28059.1 hypothetical protein CLV70_109215 [Pseudosporangium ferrugineum]BCJ52183.1 hypothetical protein Asp14428_36580 [Actinoplanes sp. NBRC 14428]